jgi:putative DNA primase/helicase
MAIKKVRRPVLSGPNKGSENQLREKSKNLFSSNHHSSIETMKNDHDSNELKYYLSPVTQQYFRFLASSQKIKKIVRMLPEEKSLSLLKTIFNKLAGSNGIYYFIAMLKVYDGTPSPVALNMFQGASEMSETLLPEDVMNEIELLIKVSNAEERGFLFDEKKKMFTFNSNAFVKHFKKRCTAILTEDGRIYVYNKRGFYKELSLVALGRLIRSVMHEGVPDSWKSKSESEAIKALQREIPIVKEMNNQRNFINLRTGMLCLDTFKLYNHNAKYLSTVQLPIEYDMEEKAPNFMKFMSEITLDDSSLINVHQEIMGYLLTAETKAERVFYYYGTGANGKSVLATVITHLVGQVNVSNIPLSQFSDNFGLESIINKTVNISSENELGDKSLNTEMLKALVSGDRININIKYHAHIDYQPFCKPLFLINNFPNTTDLTNGYSRRVMILPFNRTFKEHEQDVQLKDTLLSELPGILNWALMGLKRLQVNKFRFSSSQVIEDCQQKYLDEQNPVKEFIREHIVFHEGTRTSKPDFYEAYIQWLDRQEIDEKRTRSRQIFWKFFKAAMSLEEIPLKEKKVKGFIFYEGLEIVGLSY